MQTGGINPSAGRLSNKAVNLAMMRKVALPGENFRGECPIKEPGDKEEIKWLNNKRSESG